MTCLVAFVVTWKKIRCYFNTFTPRDATLHRDIWQLTGVSAYNDADEGCPPVLKHQLECDCQIPSIQAV